MPSGPQCIPHENIMEIAGRPMNGHAIERHVRDSLAIAIAQKETLGLKHVRNLIYIDKHDPTEYFSGSLRRRLEPKIRWSSIKNHSVWE